MDNAPVEPSDVDPTRPLTPKDVAQDINDDLSEDGAASGFEVDSSGDPEQDVPRSVAGQIPPD